MGNEEMTAQFKKLHCLRHISRLLYLWAGFVTVAWIACLLTLRILEDQQQSYDYHDYWSNSGTTSEILKWFWQWGWRFLSLQVSKGVFFSYAPSVGSGERANPFSRIWIWIWLTAYEYERFTSFSLYWLRKLCVNLDRCLLFGGEINPLA